MNTSARSPAHAHVRFQCSSTTFRIQTDQSSSDGARRPFIFAVQRLCGTRGVEEKVGGAVFLVSPYGDLVSRWGSQNVRETNKQCDFRLLSCEYPTRLQLLKDRQGDRLRK